MRSNETSSFHATFDTYQTPQNTNIIPASISKALLESVSLFWEILPPVTQRINEKIDALVSISYLHFSGKKRKQTVLTTFESIDSKKTTFEIEAVLQLAVDACTEEIVVDDHAPVWVAAGHEVGRADQEAQVLYQAKGGKGKNEWDQ